MEPDITPSVDNVETFKINPAARKEAPASVSPMDGEPASFEVPAIADAAIAPAVSSESPSLHEDRSQPIRLEKMLAGIDYSESKKIALSHALALWGTTPPIQEYPGRELIDPGTYFSLTTKQNGFMVHRIKSSLDGISKLNLPAIFEFSLPGMMESHYLTMSRMDDERLTFLTDTEDGEIKASFEEVERLWTGFVYIPWINFLGYKGVTPISGSGEDVLKLKRILEKIGYQQLPPGSDYDAQTKSIIKKIQYKYSIPVDGLVGPLTKMVLYNEMTELGIPHIRESVDNPQAAELKVID
jgi:general secretion pathway protein A